MDYFFFAFLERITKKSNFAKKRKKFLSAPCSAAGIGEVLAEVDSLSWPDLKCRFKAENIQSEQIFYIIKKKLSEVKFNFFRNFKNRAIESVNPKQFECFT